MARRSWNDLDPRTRQGILVAGGVEAGLKLAALIDLAGRPAASVRGGKGRWVIALLLVNSLGVLPIAYFLRGRFDAR